MRKHGFTLVEAVLTVAILAIIAAALVGPAITCKRVAAKMGMNHDFAYGQGCMVEAKPGKWVLLRNYRMTDGGATQ